MATPVTSVREYCSLLIKSKLLPAEEVKSLGRKWESEGRGRDDPVNSFRKFLVSRQLLTEYQAALVQRGRADGFFLGEYKILDRVGKGQMGGVYKAVHNSGQVVALKILPASRATDPHLLGRFQREARLLIQLDHPNVVRAFQVGESNGVHYIAMEFLEGETLDEVLARRKRLPVPEAARLLCQAFEGLQHLHEKRTVHRDLKPSNLMLTPEPAEGQPDTTWEATVKVLDIGLGRELFADPTSDDQTETQLTADGAVLGTPDYLAPEQAKDARSADVRADIYSLGCVLYHCVAGRPPFPDTNIMAQMLKHATERPAPLAALAEGVPAGLQEVLDRLLAKRPADRYQTPGEAAEALQPFVGGGGAPAAVADMVPAFKDWLQSESGVASRLTLPPPEPGAAPSVPTKTAPTPAAPRPAWGAARPAPLPPEPAPPPPEVTAPPAPAKPVAVPVPKPGGAGPPAPGVPPRVGPTKPGGPVAPAKVVPTKPGTAPAPALKSPPAPRPPATPQAADVTRTYRPPDPQEVDVELVVEPLPAPAPVVLPPPERPTWPPDRRDWIMLALGAAGVLGAVGFGYGLARVLRRKDDPPPTE